MCRMFASMGEEFNLWDVLVASKHSLIKQTWRPPLENSMIHSTERDHHINYDGYGVVARVEKRGGMKKLFVYKTSLPPTHDNNLRVLEFHSSRFIMGHVRAIKPFSPTPHYDNCHPFTATINNKEYVWMHNGAIDSFTSVKKFFCDAMTKQAPAP